MAVKLISAALKAARAASKAAAKKAKTAKEALAKAERQAALRVGTATKPGVKTVKGLGVTGARGRTVAQAPLRSRGRKVVGGTVAAGTVGGGIAVARNAIKKAEADAKKARAEAAAATKRADAAEKQAAAADEKGSFRKRRAARLKKRIAKPGGSEERKKIQRTRLKRVMKRMADGGIAKMQGGGLSQAQQNMLRQAQENAARSGQNPATLQRLTAQHGDLYGAGQQKKARSQMAGNQPGRTSMRGIGPGMKSGGAVKKKSGGAVKMQGGGRSRAQQNMLRQAQEYAASSGQNPAALRKLTAQHGDLWGASQQKKAKRQMAGSKPGRKAMRGIGPRGKEGGAVKKQRGGELTHMASGDPIQWQSGPTGQRRKRDYMSYMAPGVAKRQMGRQAAAGGPGRGAIGGAGPGGKKGGVVKATKKSKPRGVGVAKRGFGRASR